MILGVCFLSGKAEQVQSDFFTEFAIDNAFDDCNDHLASGADIGFVEVAAKNLALIIAGTHMQMRVKLAMHGVDCASQRNNFISSFKVVGMVLLCLRVEHADGKVIDSAQSLYAGQLDFFYFENSAPQAPLPVP